MILKCAGEIMHPLDEFPYIPYWFTLRQAIAELEEQGASPERSKCPPWIILLFNAQNQFLGIVQRQDILKGLRPSVLGKSSGSYSLLNNELVDPNLSRLCYSTDNAMQGLKTQLERQIIEFMIPFKTTIDFHDPALLAIYLMIDYGLTFVPVIQSDQVVGILYVEDALREVVLAVK